MLCSAHVLIRCQGPPSYQQLGSEAARWTHDSDANRLCPKKRRTPWSGNLSNRHHSHIMLRRGRTGMPFSMMNAVMPFAPLSGCVFAYTITVSATVPFVHLERRG